MSVRIVEQLDNLKEYFFNYLPRQKDQFRELKKTERYQRIASALKSEKTESYLAFCAFLLQFQHDLPMIHVLYNGMMTLKGLMRKFIKKKYLQQDGKSKDDDAILEIDVLDKDKAKVADGMVIGTRANLLFSQCTILRGELSAKFRAECLRFNQISTKYLNDNLPINVKVITHAQYLHHEKHYI